MEPESTRTRTSTAAPLGEPRKALALYFSLPILSWALYDFANTIFSSNIVTIFFPFYLQNVIGKNEVMNQIASTFITYTNSVSSFFLVLLSPLFGTWIDRTGKKKSYLVAFTLLCVASTLLMGAAAGWKTGAEWFGLNAGLALVLLMFMFAKFFYNSGLIFYDAMIGDLAKGKEVGLVSGFGVAVGYVGTLMGLTVYPLVGEHGFHKAFIPSALLFLLFFMPLWLFYRERPQATRSAPAGKPAWWRGYADIWRTFKEARQYKNIFLFMIAYFLFNDVIATAIAVMSVYAKAVVGFSTGQFILLYLVSTVSSIAGSFAFGYVTRSVGAKRTVTIVAALLIAAVTLASTAASQGMFWAAGSMYGIAMGAMWVASRTLIVNLSPPEKRGQFFGLFAFSGKLSSIFGPTLYGTITLVLAETGNLASRIALGSLVVLVAVGLLFHAKVKVEHDHA
ncbi:MFS transporter [Gordoniibacillus kamchatkensis]|uniref:MFS transporter n=1 Tax=Gordoniibacillus kamchatkensis TaxID=1590651 RepID=A0ABR5AEX0_9BACL|nr:MFS transporter [Paenibacillus sp. VKM B-2647]KIL39531.1 MFS transporter [Paenibacillus sp. VKM B-2647]